MLGKDVRTEEIRPVANGAEVFKLMDSIGMPFDTIRDLMEDQKIAFDVCGFIFAARNSKNYSEERLIRLLTQDIANDPELIEKTIAFVQFFYRKTDKGEYAIQHYPLQK